MLRAVNSHDLLEKRDKGSQDAKAKLQRNTWIAERAHVVGATFANKKPKSLIQLGVGKAGQELARIFQCVRYKCRNVFWFVLPSRASNEKYQAGLPVTGWSKMCAIQLGNEWVSFIFTKIYFGAFPARHLMLQPRLGF